MAHMTTLGESHFIEGLPLSDAERGLPLPLPTIPFNYRFAYPHGQHSSNPPLARVALMHVVEQAQIPARGGLQTHPALPARPLGLASHGRATGGK